MSQRDRQINAVELVSIVFTKRQVRDGWRDITRQNRLIEVVTEHEMRDSARNDVVANGLVELLTKYQMSEVTRQGIAIKSFITHPERQMCD